MKACAEVKRGRHGAGVGGCSIRWGEVDVSRGDDWEKWALAGGATSPWGTVVYQFGAVHRVRNSFGHMTH